MAANLSVPGTEVPAHWPADLRTMALAEQVAGSNALAVASVQAGLLAELVATLHEAGALPTAAVSGLARRWQAILQDWPGAPQLRMHTSLTASFLAAELAWQMPGVVQESATKPVRVGRKRRARRRPDASG
jgi:hypothetical protein